MFFLAFVLIVCFVGTVESSNPCLLLDHLADTQGISVFVLILFWLPHYFAFFYRSSSTDAGFPTSPLIQHRFSSLLALASNATIRAFDSTKAWIEPYAKIKETSYLLAMSSPSSLILDSRLSVDLSWGAETGFQKILSHSN